ncbi:2-oxoglutarate dehydrogenase E1 component [Mariprofundus ferrinatatus]|uniref:oxoglutarate dehydrogenase (succinyl-transferring) n=1 Tax=Mariprofundus ferrinatatus TaxID=1921087 RepID=A0A2K8L2J9_9PROT|nr:2-oxoglutarate dehydrogenase E1 component [Mariprofundus ferrinatatus]ATX81473.1 2-oxoglutarate dehydrogenase E1 component [Mariprofundus ferrinatatus]
MSQPEATSVATQDELFSAGSTYLEQMYEQYLRDPESLAPQWVDYFSDMVAAGEALPETHQQILARMRPLPRSAKHHFDDIPSLAQHGDIEYPSRAILLIQAYRMHGHLHADLDPLRLNPRPSSPELELGYYGLSESDLEQEFPTGDLTGDRKMALGDIVMMLQRTYCSHIGPEFVHITDSARRHWIQSRLERIQSLPDYDEDTRRHIYGRIMHAEELERFLHTRYLGQKRFSLEGGESLIPMLDALVQRAGSGGTREIIMGMAHRGRLNVLANIMGKSLSDIFSEFEGTQFEDAAQGQGDVKYHKGFSSDVRTPSGIVHLSLGFNPSHLEIITPVVLGSVRARQCRRKDKSKVEVMSVLIHGDAAFAGQGVVAESLQLSKLRGFRIGGTIHIVVNNQIGFTVNPFDARSTTYCTDIAKIVQAPILHVNGDDPEACCLAAEIAVEYRNTFHEDIVIDLICYRRHGHNEADAPEVTQPEMYRRIGEHPTVGTLYRDRLIRDHILSNQDCDEMIAGYRDNLETVRRANNRRAPSPANSLQGRWEGFVFEGAEEPDTAVNADLLSDLARRVHRLPSGFSLHPKVEAIYENRIEMMDGKQPVDWGCGETMAYATLVHEGGWVRLTGEDSGRSTFFHRHAVVYDQNNGKSMIPLRQVENGPLSHFIVVDSMLSEMAVMGYEYGYSVAEPRALVIWEAQYGDFTNIGQVVVDQFIAAGETKWSRMSGLVLWLPHGYEGQGAEHSSARLERFLQLCAENNMQVVYPTTPAQLFHLFRRQLMSRVRKPLIMMGPKSMLRNKLSFSPFADFTDGAFLPVMGERHLATATPRRVIFCSGKVYYDLLAERQKREIEDVVLLRIERLYPFPADELRAEIDRYADTHEIFWVQEEPANQGAWLFVNSPIRQLLLPNQKIFGVTRPESAAPAVGSAKRHKQELEALLNAAFAEGVDGCLADRHRFDAPYEGSK